MTRDDLRRCFGMVLQDTWLFGGTIRDNIAYGADDPSEEQILAAAQAAHVDHFVRTMPDGYDTVLDDEASNLSAGEKQLLTIARAFLADPPILILDEATSSVDTRTEVLIQQAMATLREGRTSFVIAHRLSTIRDADMILVMDAGRIVEQGTHDELLAAQAASTTTCTRASSSPVSTRSPTSRCDESASSHATNHNSHMAVTDVIRCLGCSVQRGDNQILHDIDFTIYQGQLVGLLGPSGSGKTTLMRALVGVQRYTGSAAVLGLPAGHVDLRRRIGYVTQAPSVYADLTVDQNLRYFAQILSVDPRDIEWAMERVDMTRFRDAMVHRLSGGEQSRVSLATALLGRPEVLILDEPTVGLDPILRRDLWSLFRTLADDGATLLISSHVMDEATRCDRLLLLRDGRVLADGPLNELERSTGTQGAEAVFLHLAEGHS